MATAEGRGGSSFGGGAPGADFSGVGEGDASFSSGSGDDTFGYNDGYGSGGMGGTNLSLPSYTPPGVITEATRVGLDPSNFAKQVSATDNATYDRLQRERNTFGIGPWGTAAKAAGWFVNPFAGLALAGAGYLADKSQGNKDLVSLDTGTGKFGGTLFDGVAPETSGNLASSTPANSMIGANTTPGDTFTDIYGGSGYDDLGQMLSAAPPQAAPAPSATSDASNRAYSSVLQNPSYDVAENFRSAGGRRKSYAVGGEITPNGPPGLQPQGGAPMSNDMLSQEVSRFAQAQPQEMAQIKQAMIETLQSGELDQQGLNMVTQLAKAAAQNPQLYPQLRQFAIQQGLADETDMPPEYDQGLIFAVLLAGQSISAEMSGQAPVTPGVPMSDGQAPIAGMALGGALPKESKNADGSIPINAHEGEFMFPKEARDFYGTEKLDKMIAKAREAKNPTPPDGDKKGMDPNAAPTYLG